MLPRNKSFSLLTREDVASGRTTHWEEMEVTAQIRCLSPRVGQMQHLTAIYVTRNHLTTLPKEISTLINLRRLDVSYNQITHLPPEIGDLKQLRELMLTNNMLQQLPFDMGKLVNLEILGLEGNPLAVHFLGKTVKSLISYLLDHLYGNCPPPPSRLTMNKIDLESVASTAVVTVMTYNVLSQSRAFREEFVYCPPWALNWEYRKLGILTEIMRYSPDLLALQDVEEGHFHDFFLPRMMGLGFDNGYQGIFQPKSCVKKMSAEQRRSVVGCAVFWKTTKFRLLRRFPIEFSQMARGNPRVSPELRKHVLTLDNVAAAVLLETTPSCWYTLSPKRSVLERPQTLLVATTQLDGGEEYKDVKLIQTLMLIHKLEQISKDARRFNSRGSSARLVLAGDFNSTPNSAVYQFLTTGKISAQHQDFMGKQFNIPYCLPTLSIDPSCPRYVHNLNIALAYDKDTCSFTTFTERFKGTVDYVFLARQSIVVKSSLGPLDPNWLETNRISGLPNPHVLSDHLPMAVTFALNEATDSGNDE